MTPEEEKSIIQPLRDLQKELRLKEIEDRESQLQNLLDKKEKEWWSKKNKKMADGIFEDDFDAYWEFVSPENKELSKLNREKRMLMTPEFSEPMTETGSSKMLGNLYTIENFIGTCKFGGFVDSDGSGDYAKEIDGKMMRSNIDIYPSDIKHKSIRKDFTHVIWYNK